MGTHYYIVMKATPEELKVLEKFGLTRVQLHIGKKSNGIISDIRTHTQFEIDDFLRGDYPELKGQINCLHDFDRFFNHPDFEIISEYEEIITREKFLSFIAEYMSGEFS